MTRSSLNGGNSLVRVSLTMALFFAFAPAVFAQQGSTEAHATATVDHAAETAIKQVLDTYTDAWNRYDSHTLATLFTEDCDYVVGGGDTHGRAALETSFAKTSTAS